MMKRFFCILICIMLVCQVFTVTAAAEGIETITKPTVFISGEDEYNVVWVTDMPSAAFVEMTLDGASYIYRDEIDGVIRVDDYIHTVRVPKSVLDSAKEYTVISRTVSQNDINGVVYDSEIRESYSFTPYSGDEEITFGFFSDLHLKPTEFTRLDYAQTILDEYIGGADVIVLNGDITDAMPTENYFTETLLEASHRLSGGTLPVVYARGNHEARGEYAQYLSRYLAFDTGEMYGTFSYGPISSIVADCGEDKADYRDEYGGMVDFDNYNAKQLSWLENMGGYQEGAEYNLAISHSPAVIDRMKEPALTAMLKHDSDIMVSGHYHTAQKYAFSSFPIVTDGGIINGGYRAGALVFRDGTMNFNVYKNDGENVFTFTAKTQANTQTVVPESNIITAPTGVTLPALSQSTKGGLSASNLRGSNVTATVTVDPVVFDCGDVYNIVYMTDAGSEMSKAEAVVQKDGVSYTFTDSKMGNVVSNLLHSIAVPKDILEGATYRIKTTYMGGYGAYGENIAYDGLLTDLGYTLTSDEYEFASFEGKDNLCIAAFSDMTGGITDAVKVKNSMTVTPDIIVLGGNLTEGIYSKAELVKSILAFAEALSGGETPVILLRGAGESYGDYAPYISETLTVERNGESGGLYFATSYGDINIIVCDTAGGRLSAGYYQKQTEWIKSLKLSGTHTFVAAADEEFAKTLMGDSFAELGCVKVIGRGEGYGNIVLYDAGNYGETKNTFAGSAQITKQPITATINEGRIGTEESAAVTYKTDAQKQEAINADTENEAVVQRPTDLAWYTLTIYDWIERGLDKNLPDGQVTAMGCSQFLVAYSNLSGVDLDKVSGTNRQSRAISWAYGAGVISYSPPMLHEFTTDEISTIIGKK